LRKLAPFGVAVLIIFALLTTSIPKTANAGTGIYPIDSTGIRLTLTTPDTHSLCSSGTDSVTISGMPSNGAFRLLGAVDVQFVLADGGRQLVPHGHYPVDTTGNLSLVVSYPPIDQWPVQGNGTAEIHVDIAIQVYVNGVLEATLGPRQQWDVFCRNQSTATLTPTDTRTPTATPSSTPSSTPTDTATSTATATATATPSSTATASSTPILTPGTPSPTPSSTVTSAGGVTPSPLPSSTATSSGVTPTPINTVTSVPGPAASASPTNSGGAAVGTPIVTPTVVLPAGIPVTGEGPGTREISVMLLAGLGVGLLALWVATSLARRGRHLP